MSAKTLLTLPASMLLGAAIVAPNAAFAQFLPPPPPAPGPPPFLAGPLRASVLVALLRI
jgi:hypothetical protein